MAAASNASAATGMVFSNASSSSPATTAARFTLTPMPGNGFAVIFLSNTNCLHPASRIKIHQGGNDRLLPQRLPCPLDDAWGLGKTRHGPAAGKSSKAPSRMALGEVVMLGAGERRLHVG